MARGSAKLNALAIQRAKKAGLLSDGGGLYLRISESGTKSWVFRFMLSGRAREMGLGSVALRSLAEAREKALEARKLLLEDIDPIEARLAKRRDYALEIARTLTFDECAAAYIEGQRSSWKNAKHASQWESTLVAHVTPVFGSLPVGIIDTSLVMRALEPIWHRTPETASRIRNRIELILDWATAREYRTGANPARWRGHLDKLLPKRSKIRSVKHFAALPFDDLPLFLSRLRAETGLASVALEFLILTAVRSGEVRGALWKEINFKYRIWTIPAERMKAKREHRVPLSPRAIEILENLLADTKGQLVFEGRTRGRPLSDMTLTAVLRRMKCEVTAHGFRSTFRDWAGERTTFPREVAEAALAHTIKNRVEAAYRRSDSLEKRRKLMEVWANYCCQTFAQSPPAKVLKLGNEIAI